MASPDRPELEPSIAQAEIPALHDDELRGLYHEGWQRIGIVAFIADTQGNLLLLEHRESDKTTEGMWGPLGETSKVRLQDEAWEIESPTQTLLRGFTEELDIECSASDFLATEETPYFTASWPIGVSRPDEFAFAICPVVVVSDHLKASIEASTGKDEVKSAVFLPYTDIKLLSSLRPGTNEWLDLARATISDIGITNLVPLAETSSQASFTNNCPDAIFSQMYA